MSDTTLDIVRAGGIATLTMNRPERHNAFDDALIAELTQALESLAADSATRAVVLAGAGRSFSAGADIGWMRRMAGYGWDDNYRDSRALAHLMHVLDTLPVPTLARVHGAALGGGVGLVACCDIAIAAEAAVFALPEVRLGLIPAAISPYVVNAIGSRQARRYFVTGERFDAATAARLGLVHETVPAGELDDRLAALTAALAGNGPLAMAEAKRLAREVARGPLDEALRAETARRIADQRASAEGREGLAAFLDKRPPTWHGTDTGSGGRGRV